MDEPSSKHSSPTTSEAQEIERDRAGEIASEKAEIAQLQQEFSEQTAYDHRAPGEPEFRRIIWDLPDPYDPTTLEQAQQEIWELRSIIIQQQRSQRWLRKELERLRLRIDPTQDSAAVAEIKQKTVATLRELLPQAQRAAKRGKPALLRLILRTIKTKL